MSNPKRTLGLLGVLALTISACSSGGSASSAPGEHRAERGSAQRRRIRPRLGRGRARDHRLVAYRHRRPRQGRFRGHRQGLRRRPTRTSRSRSRSLENEAFKTKLARHPGGRLSRPLPVVGRRDHGRPGRRRAAPGHHRRRGPLEGHRQRRCDEHLPVQGRPVRHPVGHGDDRLLVQQGPLPEGRRHARPPRGTSTWPPSRSSRRPAWPRSPSRARTSGRRCTSGRTCCSATAAATRSAR